MKNLIIFSFLLILISCGEEEVERDIENNSKKCIEVDYDIKFSLTYGEEVCFSDGNSFYFKDAEHHLCPCEVLCDSEGDLLILLETFTVSSNFSYNSKKEFYTREVANNSNIFSVHEIQSFSFAYGNEDEEVPACAADFEPEKMKLSFIISEK